MVESFFIVCAARGDLYMGLGNLFARIAGNFEGSLERSQNRNVLTSGTNKRNSGRRNSLGTGGRSVGEVDVVHVKAASGAFWFCNWESDSPTRVLVGAFRLCNGGPDSTMRVFILLDTRADVVLLKKLASQTLGPSSEEFNEGGVGVCVPLLASERVGIVEFLVRALLPTLEGWSR